MPAIILYAGFAIVRTIYPEYAPEVGERNAGRIGAAQDALGIGWDASWQQAALWFDWLIVALNWYYILAFAPLVVMSGIVAFRHSSVLFDRWRIAFVVTVTLAVAGPAIFPVTPPRLLDGDAALIDTLAIYGPSYYGGSSPDSTGVFNVHGAMPSMHVGWTTFAAAVLWSTTGRQAWLIGPLLAIIALMGFAVVATGNHFVLDGIVGIGIVLVSMGIIWVWQHRRPTHPIAPDPSAKLRP